MGHHAPQMDVLHVRYAMLLMTGLLETGSHAVPIFGAKPRAGEGQREGLGLWV